MNKLLYMKTEVQSKVDKLLKDSYQLKLGEVLSKAGDIFKGIAGYAILALLIYAIIYYLLSLIVGLIYSPDQEELMAISQTGDYDQLMTFYKEEFSNPMFRVSMLANLLVGSLVMPILYSIITMARKYDLKQSIQFSDIFVHYTDGKFAKLYVASLIISIVTSIGFTLCLIPGIFIYGIWLLVIPFIIFADASIGEAFEASRKIAFKSLGSFILAVLLIFAILLLGFIMCCVGLIAALPLVYVFIYVMYKEIVGFDDVSEIDQIGNDSFKSVNNPYTN